MIRFASLAFAITGCATIHTATGYSPDAGHVLGVRPEPHPAGYVVFSGWIAREFGLQVGDTLPAVTPDSVPLPVLHPPVADVGRWYFRVGSRFLVYSIHTLTLDNMYGTLVDSSGTQSGSLQFWDATFCGPATPAAGMPCGSDRWPDGPDLFDSQGETDEEATVRDRFAPAAFTLETRNDYLEWFARATFSRGRRFCYVNHPQLARPHPFECGILTVGLVADSLRRATLPRALRDLRAEASGPLSAGHGEVLVVHVPLGTERNAIAALLRTEAVRYVEPFWQDTLDVRRP